MKISSFEDDLLGLEDFARRLEQFIAIEHQYVEGSLVVGLTSKFGSGKSSFLQMWKSSLETASEAEGKPKVILLNAWESDYYGDPLFAIISAIAHCNQINEKSTAKIVEAAKDFGWYATAISGQVAKQMTGIDPIAAGEFAEKKKKEREKNQRLLSDTFSIYEKRINAMASLKSAIQALVEGENTKILFLVDELDRCRPDYAISYLETIKHIFDVKGVIFLLATDRSQLENSARTAFGADLDFEEYYRKFVHREVTLPNISDENYQRLALKYVNYYLERENQRSCYIQFDHYQIDSISKLIGTLKLTPRQIQEAFRIIGHLLETTQDKKGGLYWCLGTGSILMSVLKIGNSRIFNLLGTQQLLPKEAFNFFNQLFKGESVNWWFTLCFTGGGLKTEEDENFNDIMKSVGSLKDNGSDLPIDLAHWHIGWGNSGSRRFAEIYKKIEQLYQWK
ncbi:KAP family P-loop NTPase fold protein [Nitrosomonas supralitoralis]|uniref:KAP NTPase domain-containing protein n=1 Tax=Nitrosomonas supralitoralis TaxID=2116706 RepID=A0A2P7NXF4_9PROT|nr:P-loop NTPase fold protein [Nitrosomonas supralitoralis]PSJ18148.1 hypothetical protein C7H79_04675 [Nitrosomonas supralitoralis]